MKKIAKYGTELTQWSRQNFGSVRRELAEKKKALGEGRTSGNATWLQFSGKEIH